MDIKELIESFPNYPHENKNPLKEMLGEVAGYSDTMEWVRNVRIWSQRLKEGVMEAET